MSMDALPTELVKHILSFDLGTTFAVASRVNRTWKQLALSQLSSITSLTISYDVGWKHLDVPTLLPLQEKLLFTQLAQIVGG